MERPLSFNLYSSDLARMYQNFRSEATKKAQAFGWAKLHHTRVATLAKS